jgi:hypothetical protein
VSSVRGLRARTAIARAVWRTRLVSEAAAAPLPHTSPMIAVQSPARISNTS